MQSYSTTYNNILQLNITNLDKIIWKKYRVFISVDCKLLPGIILATLVVFLDLIGLVVYWILTCREKHLPPINEFYGKTAKVAPFLAKQQWLHHSFPNSNGCTIHLKTEMVAQSLSKLIYLNHLLSMSFWIEIITVWVTVE